MTAQARINEIQADYKQWLNLKARLEHAQEDLKESLALMTRLEAFYDSEWRTLYEAIENGLAVDLKTEGEYSVMGEDTLWNAFEDQRHLLLEQRKLIDSYLKKYQDE